MGREEVSAPAPEPEAMSERDTVAPLALGPMLGYAAASLGTGAFYAFSNAALPLFLRPLTDSDVVIGLLSSTRSLGGAVVQPLVGAWSDRLWTPLGRRRPFLLAAVPPAALLLVLTPYAPSLAWVALAIVLLALLFNIAVDPYLALLADITPLSQRATLSSLATLVQFSGQVGVTLAVSVVAAGATGGIPPAAFQLVALVLVVSFAITIVTVRESPHAVPARPRFGWRAYVASLLACREAMKFFVGLFVLFFGINAVVPFLTLYAVREIGVTEAEALLLFLVMVAVTGMLAVPFGRLGDRGYLALPGSGGRLCLRVGPAPAYRQLIGFGIVCLGVAALLGTVATELPHLLLVEVLAGVGNSALTVLWWPMLTELIPRERTGVFAGLSATVQSIALPASVVLAGVLIDAFDSYRVVFGLLALMSLLALGVCVWLRQAPRAPALA
jgi:maltose/moltooligosaccharide transporter